MNSLKSKLKINTLSVLTGGVSAGASMAMDIKDADAVFESARTANSMFAHMSDSQIVDYCNTLEPEQLMGMVNLVHGRHFENIVADATGGELFEAKNHPDTDMVLDGTEYSIKSHDATADSITEFETFSPQDLGLDDADLRDETAEILEGDIIDISDALFNGALGFGTMATLQALGEGAEEWGDLAEYEKTKIKAALIGTKTVGNAAVGTAKSALNVLKLLGKGSKEIYKAHQRYKAENSF